MISIKKPDVTFTLSVLTIFCLPSFIFVMFGQESLAPGLVLASLLVTIINFKELIGLTASIGRLILYESIITLVFISASYSYINAEITKPIFSLPALLFVFFSASVFSEKLKKMRFQRLESSLLLVILFFLCLGWIEVFMPITWGAYGSQLKPVFPFSEQSHYALSVGLFSVAYAVTGRKNIVFFIIINLFLLSLVLPNLTLLVSSTLTLFASTIRLRPKYFKLVLLVSPVIIVMLLSILSMNDDYFSSRLSFEESTNLTTLAFLQGWYLAFINTLRTNGLGLGFQMVGMPGTHLTPFSEAIEAIGGSALNLTDAGLLAAKVIAEFGIIGLILSLLYSVFIIKFLFNANAIVGRLRFISNDRKQLIQKRLLLHGLLFGFVTELFFRGYGYFSPGLYLVVAVIISTNNVVDPGKPST